MIDTPYTLDHYVGQTEFPEYSILTKNLLPCCFKCNQQKNETWRSNNVKTFLNFYDDRFLQYPFLIADMQFIRNIAILSFTLIQPAEINNLQFALINRHFSALGLLEKYNKKSNNRLSSEIKTIQYMMGDGWIDADIRAQLLARYNGFSIQYGPNYWECHIYKALADHLTEIRLL
ncbi:hypothetical protein [Pedobacter sp. HMWF019]|uniref:hypothetical protein n=1 Tax=Pedobacter sp. HMWF019 TaxID=2056856 RepID=UPI0011B283D1|nr:hypothetical protein [Pedobacter sp. HMWF019]